MTGNFVLDSLPDSDKRAMKARLQPVTLARHTVVCEQDRQMSHAYLPLNCILSAMTVMRDGREVESRTVGREAGVGLLQALGSRRSFERVLVQAPGECLRISIEDLQRLAQSSETLSRCLVKHAQIALAQAVRGAACNALHGAEERLCKWLLLTRDRLDGDVLPLTQEHLSIMLGVQRTTVTAVAIKLQEEGLIEYSRGKIRVRAPAKLLSRSCECYEALTKGAQDLLSDPCD